MTKVGVLIIHGMGNQKAGYSAKLRTKLGPILRKRGVVDRVVFKEARWSPVIQPAEDALYSHMTAKGTLRFRTLRRFIVSAFGDAVAYQPSGSGNQGTYARIHANIQTSLDQLAAEAGPDAPLVVVAHSLGSIIASNMIWDAQHGKSPGTTPFGRFETLAGLVTFGSTLPLFTLRLNRIEMIQFPGPAIAAGTALHKATGWHNFYDRHDVLGWPLRAIPQGAYKHDHVKDHVIDVGWLPWNLTPLSHGKYWTDKDFVKPVARLISDIATAA